MSLMLQKGDYVSDGNGGFCEATEKEVLLQRVLFRLTARRGGFVFRPEFGSQLYRLPMERASQRAKLAKQYVEEALAEEAGLVVQDVEWREQQGMLVVHLSYNEERVSLTFAPGVKGGNL